MMKIASQDPELDPLVRGMDTRIRIHTKMSWIRNTVPNKFRENLRFEILQALQNFGT